MQQALDVLKQHIEHFDYEKFTSICELDPAKDAILSLREALAVSEQQTEEQAEQEPVARVDAWPHLDNDRIIVNLIPWDKLPIGTELYAASLAQQDTHATHVVRTKDPCNPLQDLTDDELCEIEKPFLYNDRIPLGGQYDFARAVIAADREKNK